jgi:hypothetical protein
MSDERSWDDQFADFLHRAMAVAVANGDPQSLREEYERLLAMAPAKKKKDMGLKALEKKRQ